MLGLLRTQHEKKSSERRWENCKRPVYICENDLCNSLRQSAISTLVQVRNIESCPKAALNWTLDTPRSRHCSHQSRWFYSPDAMFLPFPFFSWFSAFFSIEKRLQKWRNEKLIFLKSVRITQEANYTVKYFMLPITEWIFFFEVLGWKELFSF